jgi:hypothetical protein
MNKHHKHMEKQETTRKSTKNKIIQILKQKVH